MVTSSSPASMLAFMTMGWPCPMMWTPIPQVRSYLMLPSASSTNGPAPAPVAR